MSRRCEAHDDKCEEPLYWDEGWKPAENCSCELCHEVWAAGGRLFTHASGYAQTARIVKGEDDEWSGQPNASQELVVPGEVKEKVARHYQLQGLAEHASVASFARTVLKLMAFGAPASLVDSTLEAAREEVQHAQMAFALARAISDPFKVSPLELDGVVIEARPNLTEFIEQTISEACVAETVAVVRAAAALQFAEDKAVRRFLHVIVAEEQRHAKLAWSTLAWALLNSGSQAHHAAQNALAFAIDAHNAARPEVESGANEAMLLRLGILSPDFDATAEAMLLVKKLTVELSLSKTNSLAAFDEVVRRLFEDGLKSFNIRPESAFAKMEV